MINKIRFSLAVFLFVFLSLNQGKAQQQRREHVAILDFKAEKTTTAHANVVRNLFEVALHKTGAMPLLERTQIQTILREQEFARTSCSTDACAVQAGKLLSVDTVVTGSINRLETYVITIRFINVRDGSIEFAESAVAGNDDDLKLAVDDLAQKASVKYRQSRMSQTERLRESRNSGISTRCYYSVPLGEFEDRVKPAAGLAVMGESRIQCAGGVDIMGVAAGLFLNQDCAPPADPDKSLNLVCLLGGAGCGYYASNSVVFRINTLGGYVRTGVEGGGDLHSNDMAFLGDIEMRYMTEAGLFFSIHSSYLNVWYSGANLREFLAGIGLGYAF